MSEAADSPTGLVDDRPCCGEVLGPRRRRVQSGGVEDGRHIGEVVRLAVDGDLQERPLAERIAEASAPAVAGKQTLDEVPGLVALARTLHELVERLHETGRQVLPDEHRPGHVDVGCIFAVQQVVDLVREVKVTRNDPDIEADSCLLLELRRMTLDACDIRIGIGTEEADDAHGRKLTGQKGPNAYRQNSRISGTGVGPAICTCVRRTPTVPVDGATCAVVPVPPTQP